MRRLFHHGGTEAILLIHEQLTEAIIGASIEVSRELGPGLLESTYEECLCHELTLRGIKFRRQVPLPIRYKGIELECGYRIDLIVEEMVVVELKAIENSSPFTKRSS